MKYNKFNTLEIVFVKVLFQATNFKQPSSVSCFLLQKSWSKALKSFDLFGLATLRILRLNNIQR